MMTRLVIAVASLAAGLRERVSREEKGASAVEYGMLVALIAAVCVATVALLGPKIAAAFQAIVDALTNNGI